MRRTSKPVNKAVSSPAKRKKRLRHRPLRSLDLIRYDDDWSAGLAMRETALLHFPEREAAAMRLLFLPLYSHHLEHTKELSETYRRSYTKGSLRAVMRDLRHIARVLAVAAKAAIEEFSFSETEEELGYIADRLAMQCVQMADLIESRISPRRPKPKEKEKEPAQVSTI